MTPVQTRSDHPSTPPTADPHVWADMTVEVALAVMHGARTARLIILDADGRRTGLVTRTQLTGFRASPAYTDRARLSELSPAQAAPRP
ncbi:hypothetical protein BX286_3570 [Streptomyces sp. 3211.6]|uniref:CBS domain-containing protein n=1 Tax=Streptomyces TaxID=1883 RepID=UPI0009A50568|nr:MULTISPECIES: CBS domain-containing protein [Streptomyces]RKT05570.1 hypothetical protein BX286_3570 [Streptomyces sp. 3211.6]RPF41504.1 hypothetical protein EDD96_5309 [Streptomyces sp. Ag109_G2-6]